jgi:hypothetical protein
VPKSTLGNGMVDTNSRIVHIEGRVDRLESDVSDIKAGVRELLNRPANPGFDQVIKTLVSTLAACAIIAGFGEWRINQAVSPIVNLLSATDIKLDKGVDNVIELRIEQAVLEERSRWLQTQTSWSTKTEPLH